MNSTRSNRKMRYSQKKYTIFDRIRLSMGSIDVNGGAVGAVDGRASVAVGVTGTDRLSRVHATTGEKKDAN